MEKERNTFNLSLFFDFVPCRFERLMATNNFGSMSGIFSIICFIISIKICNVFIESFIDQ